MTSSVLDLADVIKGYAGLRPLRIRRLTVAPGESVSLVGFDQPMAETFVNLVTGASLPDEGDVKVFGRSTSSIDDSAEWLALVDRFGILSERAVLLDGMTVIQNLAMPFTLEIEPPPEDVRAKAERLVDEVELPKRARSEIVGALDASGHARIRLARALALDPAILILEHPTAALPRDAVTPFGRLVRSIAAGRGAAIVALTADRDFASAVSSRVLTLEPASGQLKTPAWQWLRSAIR